MENIVWKFQSGDNFGFLIPKDRESYGGDFYIKKSNFWWAVDWDEVEWEEIKSSWKKPEAKIVRILWEKKENKNEEYVEWIYSKWEWNFWFIDVEWQEKGFFVYGDKRNEAKDWDTVKAQVVEFKWKKEAIVVKVFESKHDLVIWRFKDSDRFGFVIPDEWKNNDIFIVWSRKNWAKDWDMVEAKIVKEWWKNPEGVVVRILD